MKRILIADDSDSIRAVLKRHLDSNSSLTVCGEACDGVEAIEKAKQLDPDLVVLDLAMPKLNGAAAASVLKKEMPDVPIILFTLYAKSVENLGLAVGADIILAKSDGIQKLMQQIDDLFRTRSAIERDLALPH